MCLFHKKYLGDKHRTPGDWEIWRTLSLITSELQVCKQTSKATPKKLWTYCNLCTSFLFWKDFRRKQIAQPRATKNHFLCFYVQRHAQKYSRLMPCPFTGPKMFCAVPIFLCQTKNLFTNCGSHKHFVPNKKMICIQ